MSTLTRGCPVCGLSVPDAEPMVRVKVTRRVRRSWQSRRLAVCQACADGAGDDRVRTYGATDWRGLEPVACVTCGMSVILPPDPRRTVDACSDTCRAATYQRPVETTVTHCDECGTTMTGRPDRAYCSGRCRQRAYRARKGLASLLPDATPDELREIAVMGSADPERFEAALSAARASGDLSRENVVRMLRAPGNI